MSKRYTHTVETNTEYEYSIYRDGILAETSSAKFFTEAMAAQRAAERCAELERMGESVDVRLTQEMVARIDGTLAAVHGASSPVYAGWRSALGRRGPFSHQGNDE